MEIYTTHEVATLLKCTTRTLQNLRDRGEISFIRVGRLVRFTQQQIADYLKRQNVNNEQF